MGVAEKREPPAWLRAADLGLTVAGAALAPMTGGTSGAAAGAKAAAKAGAKRIVLAGAGGFPAERGRAAEVVVGIAAALILAGLVALCAVFYAAVSVLGAPQAQGGFLSGEPAEAAGEIPAEYLPAFLAAQKEYGVSWAVLAAVAKVESGFGKGETYLKRNGISPAGAVGFMQFMPSTWSGSGNPLVRDDPAAPSWDTDPARIASFGGYGVDGDGDGAADPYNPWDAVFSAANYLAANGFAEDPRAALYHYNRSWDYVNQVIETAAAYSSAVLPLGEGLWPLPPQWRQITSGFGWRVHPVTFLPDWHEGIDIAAPAGTPVLAAAPGTVVHAGRLSGYGLAVRVRHAGGAETLYGHLSEILVARGQELAAGQPVGAVGSGGVSTGPHLHFGVRVNGQAVDPEGWLGAPKDED